MSGELTNQYLTFTAFALYIAAFALCLVNLAANKGWLGISARWLLVFGLIAHAGGMVARYYALTPHHPPWTNLYEICVAMSLGLVGIITFVEFRYKLRLLAPFALIVPLVLLSFAFAQERGVAQPPPSLRSYWILMHVPCWILSYSALSIAFVASAIYLFLNRSGLAQRVTLPVDLDKLSYRLAMFAFPFLTGGLILGCLWGQDAWGSYWFHDIKEWGALIIWLTWATYLHTRKVMGWKGDRPAWLTIFGFAVIVFTFIGLSFVPSMKDSVHTYANDNMSNTTKLGPIELPGAWPFWVGVLFFALVYLGLWSAKFLKLGPKPAEAPVVVRPAHVKAARLR